MLAADVLVPDGDAPSDCDAVPVLDSVTVPLGVLDGVLVGKSVDVDEVDCDAVRDGVCVIVFDRVCEAVPLLVTELDGETLLDRVSLGVTLDDSDSDAVTEGLKVPRAVLDMDCRGVASAVLAAVSEADAVGNALLLLEGVSDGTKGVADEEEVGEALLLADLVAVDAEVSVDVGV
jgi:hypothetical protein